MIPSNQIHVKNVELSSTEVSVHVNPYNGWFYTYDPDGNELNKGTTLEETVHGSRGPLRRRKITVNVPFVMLDGRRGEALSIHSGTKNVTIKFPGERKQQIDQYAARRGFYKGDTTPETLARIRALKDSIERLQDELAIIEDECELDLTAAVREAVTAKLEESDESAWKVGVAATVAEDDSDEEAF